MLSFVSDTCASDHQTVYCPTFDERKTTHLAAYLLQKSDNNTLYILKLMKLLYIVDREALKQLGHPVTYDNYVSMKHGPVLSKTYDLMGGMVQDHAGIWNAMISDQNDHKISIADACEVSYDALSEAEMEIADQVFGEYGHIPRFELVEITHSFPEWRDPGCSSAPIFHEDILKGADFNDDQISAILDELSTRDNISKLLETA